MKKILIVLAVVLVVTIGGITAMVRELSKADEIMAAVQVNPVGITELITSLPDGKYVGAFQPSKFVGATVEVTIANHKIKGIEITEHNNLRGKPAEGIVDSVVAQQGLAVDTVTGATYSSKVILIAIETAIRGN